MTPAPAGGYCPLRTPTPLLRRPPLAQQLEMRFEHLPKYDWNIPGLLDKIVDNLQTQLNIAAIELPEAHLPRVEASMNSTSILSSCLLDTGATHSFLDHDYFTSSSSW